MCATGAGRCTPPRVEELDSVTSRKCAGVPPLETTAGATACGQSSTSSFGPSSSVSRTNPGKFIFSKAAGRLPCSEFAYRRRYRSVVFKPHDPYSEAPKDAFLKSMMNTQKFLACLYPYITNIGSAVH